MRPASFVAKLAASILIAVFMSTISRTPIRGAPSEGAARKANLDLPFHALPRRQKDDEDAPELVVFYRKRFECNSVFYCLDRSSSTCDGELAIEKREAIENVRNFSSQMEFAFVFFGQYVKDVFLFKGELFFQGLGLVFFHRRHSLFSHKIRKGS